MPHERDLLGQVRWVYEPYTRAQLAALGAPGMREVIGDVHRRMGEFVIGRAEVRPLTGESRQIGGGDGWVLVEVTHQSARERMVASGVFVDGLGAWQRSFDEWMKREEKK